MSAAARYLVIASAASSDALHAREMATQDHAVPMLQSCRHRHVLMHHCHVLQSLRGLARHGRNPCKGKAPGAGRTPGVPSAGAASSGRASVRRQAGARRAPGCPAGARQSTQRARRREPVWGDLSTLAVCWQQW